MTPTLVPGRNQVKYLSLGPNIYGKVDTLYATYTYFTTEKQGNVRRSEEVITQLSTSLFSTTKLPASITLDSVIVRNSAEENVQLSPQEASALKDQFLGAGSSGSSKPSSVIDSRPPAGVSVDPSVLSSIKESFSAAQSTFSSSNGGGVRPSTPPVTDLNLPSTGPSIVRPPQGQGSSCEC